MLSTHLVTFFIDIVTYYFTPWAWPIVYSTGDHCNEMLLEAVYERHLDLYYNKDQKKCNKITDITDHVDKRAYVHA